MQINTSARPLPPPSKHQMALMIWIAVFPTLLALNLTVGKVIDELPVTAKTLVLATIAVPIVIYALMPVLHLLRTRWITRRQAPAPTNPRSER